MNFLQSLQQQFSSLWSSMNSAQRISLIVAPLILLAGFGFLYWSNNTSGMVALSWGKVFTTEELIAAEHALMEAGLTDFQRQGRMLLVPAAEKDRYNAALLEFDAMPEDLGSQLLKHYESLSPFITEKQRHEMREAMLLKEVAQTLKAIPNVEDARVVIANPNRRNSWSQKGTVTANVTITPKKGRELSTRLVASIRAAVASMVPDLKTSDVTVFDPVNEVTYAGDAADDPLSSQLVQRIRELTKQYESQISKSLSYIPGVNVTVHVDIENLKSSVIRTQQIDPKKSAPVISNEFTVNDTQTQRAPRGEPGQVANRPASVGGSAGSDRNRQMTESDNRVVNGVSFEISEKQLLAAMPKAVQVSISVPRDYYRGIAAQRTAAGEKDPALTEVPAIEKEVLASVSKSVNRLIPADSPDDAIVVSTVDTLAKELPTVTIPWTETAWQFFREYGSTMALGAFAIYVAMMLRKSMGSLAQANASPGDSRTDNANGMNPLNPSGGPEAAMAMNALQGASAALPPKPATRRDQLQAIVRDNPEATAALLGKWIQAAK
jgi:flagellar M-ring protein FliF